MKHCGLSNAGTKAGSRASLTVQKAREATNRSKVVGPVVNITAPCFSTIACALSQDMDFEDGLPCAKPRLDMSKRQPAKNADRIADPFPSTAQAKSNFASAPRKH
jgi:hypothetical protein